jgi:HK97 family phage prohead protease
MRRTQLFELKSLDDSGQFEGIASVYGNVDSYGDIVEAGAFSKTIAERGKSVPILWQHDSRLPIGSGEVYDAGTHLGIKGQILEAVSHGADAMRLAKAGIVKGLSIGYQVLKDSWDADRKVRLLKEIKLYEVSFVTFPANELAVLTGIKSGLPDDDAYSAIQQYITEIKAGRAISAATRAKLLSAIETIQSLLADAEADEKSKEPPPHSGDILDVLRDIRKGR